MTKTNKVKTGGVMLRYAKGKPLSTRVAEYQSAFMFGRLTEIADANTSAPEKKLCVTLDAYEGVCHEAPTNSVYLFNEMKAACTAIAERWSAIKPPPGAVITKK